MDAILWLMIEPVDVWLFRDGRPFTAGENAFAVTRFPPLPSTLAGALRTYIGQKVFDTFEQSRLGDAAQSPIRFIGPLLCHQDESTARVDVYGPWPADVLTDGQETVSLQLRDVPPWMRMFPNTPGERMFWTTTARDVRAVANTWVSLSAYTRWRNGQTIDRSSALHETEIVIRESRPGIRLASARGVVDSAGGAFFFVQYVRMRPGWGLLVGMTRWNMDDADWQRVVRHFRNVREDLCTLGGERRMARFRVIDDVDGVPASIWTPTGDTASGLWRCCLLTPAFVPKGDRVPVYPAYDQSLTARLRVITLAGSLWTYTGWDYREKRPKPPRPLLPPGTVLVLEPESPPADWTESTPIGIGDGVTLGYGLAVIGRHTAEPVKET